jgi:hypothetical protein
LARKHILMVAVITEESDLDNAVCKFKHKKYVNSP